MAEQPTDWIKDAGWFSSLMKTAQAGNEAEFDAMLRRLLSEHARTVLAAADPSPSEEPWGREKPHTLTKYGTTIGVRRHRLFETNVPMLQSECQHTRQSQVWGVYGDHGDLRPVARPDGTSRGSKARNAEHAREVMGIDWMSKWDDLADAVPPAYTHYLGEQLLAHIQEAAA